MDTEQSDTIDIGFVVEQLSENFSNHVLVANPVVPEQEGVLESNGCEEKESKDGECYIFDYQKFKRVASRLGSEKDALRLKHDFTQLNLDVHLHENLSYEQTFNILEEVANNDHKKNKYVICCFLTHGDRDSLWAYDERMDITDILEIFSESPSLKGIPKIFIIQACRGKEAEFPVSIDSTDSGCSFVAEDYLDLDFLIINSTYLDTVSFKTSDEDPEKVHGSFFIDEFCRSLEQFSKNLGLLKILTVVNSRMAIFLSHLKNKELDGKKQMSCFISTLRNEIKFNRSIDIFDSIDTQFFDIRRKRHGSGPDCTNAPLTHMKVYKITAERILFLSIMDKNICKKDPLLRSAEKLSLAFASRNYFCIDFFNGFEKKKILKFLNQNSKRSEMDCLICCIAAYSRYDFVFDAFGRKISRKEIIEEFIGHMNKSFIGKPKIFIFLLCKSQENIKFLKKLSLKEVEPAVASSINTNSSSRRGSTNSELIGENLIPIHADILEICLTVPEWEQVIKPMNLFQEILERSPKEDLLSLLTEFNSKLVEKYGFFGESKKYFSMTSTFTKYLSLP